MCGLCREGRAVEIAKALTLENATPSELQERFSDDFNYFYLQESQSAFSALLQAQSQLERIVAQLKTKSIGTIYNDMYWDMIYVPAAFCRVIETLVKKGFDSDEYQNLINTAFVVEIIKTQCQLSSIFDERFFAPDSSFRTLFQSDFLFTKTACDNTLNDLKFRTDCVALLNAYVDWWHYGEGMGDCSDEHNVFLSLYPYVFLSFSVIETDYSEHKLIDRLIRKMPRFGATPDNLDVWLQRKAALKVYQTSGLEAFLPYGKEARSPLIYYLLVKNQLDEETKQKLKASILESGHYDPDEDWSFDKERMLIYRNTASWIMEQLQA